MRRLGAGAWLLMLLGCVAAGFGQKAAGAAATGDRIAGHVVSSLDGHALARATVVIAETQGGKVAQTVRAGEDGAFVITGVAAGKYSMEGSATGYLTSAYDAHEQFSTAIVTGAGLPTEDLVLRLPPAATISGRVTDESGEPVRGAAVSLFMETHGEGTSRITRLRYQTTDDLGEYEMAALRPGNYFVAATATPWYAVRPQMTNGGGVDTTRVATAIDPALNVAYPMMFYPGATDSDGATPIPVKAGDHVSADLRMMPQPSLRVTVHMSGDLQNRSMPQVVKPVFDEFEMVGTMQIVGTEAEVDGLTEGRYELRQGDPRTGGTAKTTVLDVTERPVDVDAAGGEEPGSVRITVEEAGGGRLPQPLQIQLRGKERGVAAGMAADEKGEAEFAGVKPGEYYLVVFGGERLFHVVRLAVNGKETRERNVQVSAGGRLTITAVVAAGSTGVEGVAKRDGVAVAGAMIVLVPQDPDHNLELFRRDQSDLDGTFLLPNVTPGTYTVLAIASGWTLEWGRAEVLTRYLGRGVPITVPMTGRSSVKLTEPVPVQAR